MAKKKAKHLQLISSQYPKEVEVVQAEANRRGVRSLSNMLAIIIQEWKERQ